MKRFTILIILLTAGVLAAQDIQIRTRVDLVVVPVAARGEDGRLAWGLTQYDFTVIEDGKEQTISNFSADPQPLSAAIVIDTGMGGGPMRKLAPLFAALTGGFSAFDEMAAFRFDKFVVKLSDFTSDPAVIEESFEIVKKIAKDRPVQGQAGEPLAAGPPLLRWILGRLKIGSAGAPSLDSRGGTYGPGSRVLHDAVFEAAQALEARPNNYRKIIFLVSDGQVLGSTHSIEETKARLVKDEIQFYAVGLDFSLFEGRFGVLSSYARATGGELSNALTTNGIETAFNRMTEQARNQYVLGYVSDNRISGVLPVPRKIEVKAKNSKLKLTYRTEYLQYP
jgi:VWFA-related protein